MEKQMKLAVKIWAVLTGFIALALILSSLGVGIVDFLLYNFHWIAIHFFIIFFFGPFFIKPTFYSFYGSEGMRIGKAGVRTNTAAKIFFVLFSVGLVIEIVDLLWLTCSYYIRL